jgi:hypothetical protein
MENLKLAWGWVETDPWLAGSYGRGSSFVRQFLCPLGYAEIELVSDQSKPISLHQFAE